ncbi:MAG: gliding motility-associated C-terminal domain-containing protein, partial [Sphingobacteriaceae bacterium]
TTTYYVDATSAEGCISPRTAVTVTVNPIPAAPTTSNQTICTGGRSTLTASAPGGTYHWYDAASGGTLLGADASFITPNLTITTTYYVDATSAEGCISPRTAVTVTVTPPTDPEFHYPATTFCKTGANPVPVTASTSGGTFSASAAGLVFTNNQTGEINLSASTAGTYTITFVTNTTCVYSSSLTINIVNGPDAAFSYNGPYCPRQANPFPVLPAGSTAGIFSCADAGLVFVNRSTGEIDLQQSLPGTYTVKNSIAAANGCAATFVAAMVTINALPVINAGADQVICAGQTATLNGTIGGSATSATWSGGTGTFSDPSSLHAVYTPGANETSARLTLTTNDPAGPCGAVTDEVFINLKPAPAVTSAQNNLICSDEVQNYTITSNISGTTFSWSRAAVDGISNAAVTRQTSNTITELLNNTASSPVIVTYIITPEANGCIGAAFNYEVKVKPKPSITSLPSTIICNQTNQNYILTGNTPGTTFSWSRAAVDGISNAAVTGQTSNTITEALVNTTAADVLVNYLIIPQADGCTGDAFTYTVTVKPTPAAPTVAGTTICSGNTATLTASGGTTYQWFDAATGGNLLSRDASFTTGFLSATTTFYVQTSVDDCISTRTGVTVTVNTIPSVPVIGSNSPVCNGTSLTLTTPAVTGATYHWTGPNGFTSDLQNPVILNATTSAQGSYALTITVNSCTSNAGTTDVVINPMPTLVAGSNGQVCVGETINLTASTVTGAAYSWTGPNSFTSDLQNPVIADASIAASGTYTVKATVNGCTSAAATVAVVVNPLPAAPVAGSNSPVCATTSLNLTAASVARATYNWTGPNGFTSDLQNPVIPTATTAHSGIYAVTVSVGGCTSAAAYTTVTVTPETAQPILSSNSPVCSGSQLQLHSIGNADFIYRWTGPNGFTSNLQDPVINQTVIENQGRYTVIVTTPNCSVAHTAFIDIKINQMPAAPSVSSNSPVCIKQTLKLYAETVAGGSYSWTGPNGFTSSSQNPEITAITAAQAGTYLVTVTVNGCTSATASTRVLINQPPVVFAGNDQTVCASNPLIAVAGTISGSTTIGVWTTSGSGSFTAGNNSLKGNYLPSAADLTNGNVTLTLTATAPCAVTAASFKVIFRQAPIVFAGDDQEICSNDQVTLAGTILNGNGVIWSSSGTGKFSPSATDLKAHYLPSEKDKVAGSIILTLTSTGTGNCVIASDQLTVQLVSPPKISAGNNISVMEDEKLMLTPAVTGTDLKYSWTPNLYLNNNTLKNPILTGNQDITYTLTVTGKTGCAVQDQVTVKVIRPINIPNTFTPNADGVNDTWTIKNLENYKDATVKIFNRYGAQLFYSEGYGVPWNGTLNGQPLPVGTYYYLIDLKTDGKTRSGPVTIIR